MARRQLLAHTLLGAGALGLRALATGLPASFLLDPIQAPADAPKMSPQYLIFATTADGQPLGNHAPGSYNGQCAHPSDARLVARPLSLGGR